MVVSPGTDTQSQNRSHISPSSVSRTVTLSPERPVLPCTKTFEGVLGLVESGMNRVP